MTLEYGNSRSFSLPFGSQCRLFSDIILFLGAALYLAWAFSQLLATDVVRLADFILLLNASVALFGLRGAVEQGRVLYSVFFIFNFIFLGIAPLQQIAAGYDPIFRADDLVQNASLLCFAFTLMGFSFMYYRPLPKRVSVRRGGFMSRALDGGAASLPLALIIVTGATTCILAIYYGSALFSNRAELAAVVAAGNEKSTVIFIKGFFHPFIFVGAVAGMLVSSKRRSTLGVVLCILILCGAILINNPFVQARFRSSALAVFFLLAILGSRQARVVVWLIIGGIFVSPIYNSIFRNEFFSSDQREFAKFFTHMDFDALNIFCYVIKWVDDRGLAWGSNLLGSILFFIPRSIWGDKGQHPAEIIFTYLHGLKGYTNSNLSAPPPLEGYLSFGNVGALLVCFIVIWVFDWVERRGNAAEVLSPWRLILCISPMLLMLLLRGPMQVGISEWVMHSAAILFVAFLLRSETLLRPTHANRWLRRPFQIIQPEHQK